MNRVKGFLALLLVMFFTSISAQTTVSDDIYQLRKYKLQPQHQEFFIANFKSHTMPIMQKYGFEYSTFARTKRSAPNFITLSDETQKDLRSGF